MKRFWLKRFVRSYAGMFGLFMCLIAVVGAFVIPLFWRYSYDQVGLGSSLGPSWEHPFGTDTIGHDVFAQTLRGAQRTAQVAFAAAAFSTVIGVAVGAYAGFYGRWVDSLLMRLTDLFLVVPALAALIVLANRFSSSGPIPVAVVIALFVWMPLARLVRAEVLVLKEQEFVLAAHMLGMKKRRVLWREVMPSVWGVVAVNMALTVALAVLAESSLSFLGLGVQPPDTSLGKLVADGVVSSRTRWWLFYLPGFYLSVFVLGVNFVGEGVRRVIDIHSS